MFTDLSHDKMMEVARSHNLCLNCLKPGHYTPRNVPVLVNVANVKGHITLCCTLNQNLRHKPCSLQQNRVHLPKTSRDIKISGIAGISHHSPLHSVVNFDISPLHTKSDKINVSAVIIPRVTSDLPQQPVHHKSTWSHLHKLNVADPDFGRPGRIDIVLQGRRRLDHPMHLLHLKPNLVGYSLERPVRSHSQITVLQSIMSPQSLEMSCSANSGR